MGHPLAGLSRCVLVLDTMGHTPVRTGFLFSDGDRLTLLADARRGASWKEDRISHFFIVRSLLLILFQLVIENPVWVLGDLFAYPGGTIVRGGGAQDIVYLGVLFSLGGSMVFWAFMRRASSWLVAVATGPLYYGPDLSYLARARSGQSFHPSSLHSSFRP